MNQHGKQMVMSCKRGIYTPGELIEINDEKWIITKIERKYTDTLYLEPFCNFIAEHYVINVDGCNVTIHEYLQQLMEDVEIRRVAEKEVET